LKSQSLPPIAPPNPIPALFGRGDDEGFPALSSVASALPTGLAATRPQKWRTYSPSSLRKYQSHSHEPSEQQPTSSVRQLSREPPPTSGEHGLIGEKLESEKVKRRRKLRDGRNKEFVSTIEEDISMLIQRRAIMGYGLSRVSASCRNCSLLSIESISAST
jgi:hypothetical protein